MGKKVDYKNLVKHVKELEDRGLSIGKRELIELKDKYTINDDGDNFIVGDYDDLEDDKK